MLSIDWTLYLYTLKYMHSDALYNDWTLYLYTLKYIHSDALYWLNSLPVYIKVHCSDALYWLNCLPVYIKVHAQWCSLLTELSTCIH